MRYAHGRFVALPLLALLAWTGSVAAAEPVLSATSYGEITFGDRLEVVEARLKETAPPVEDPDENHCRRIEFKAYPDALFMVEEGIVTRVETSSTLPTSVGFTVGASLTAIKKKIPSVLVEPHQYEAAGHYLTFMTRDGKAAIVMEEAEGKVIAVRGGLIPSVQYVEGCL